MKKLTHEEIPESKGLQSLSDSDCVTLENLVDDAFEKLNMVKIINSGQKQYCMSVLTNLATEVSRITPSPKLQPLPEVMPEEFAAITGGIGNAQYLWAYVREKYGTAPREWWQDLKPGDKFVYEGHVLTFDKKTIFITPLQPSRFTFNVDDCRPYTEPSPADKLKASLTEEQKELLKQIKNLEELK